MTRVRVFGAWGFGAGVLSATVAWAGSAAAENWQDRLRALEQGAAPRIELGVPQLSQATEPTAFSIPAGPLGAALTAFGEAARLRVLVASDIVRDLRTSGVTGTFSPEDALRRLLTGTGLTYRFANPTTVTLERVSAVPGAITLDPVTVEGRRGALLDPARTEGTNSYNSPVANIGGKSATSVKEIPQSVTVVTRQRMDDQNVTMLQEAMRYTTGMTVHRFDSAGYFNNMVARGHNMDSMLLDGVSLTHHGNLATSMDMSIYDRAEVLRGPAGMFQGAGEPSGTINLARKRALAQPRVAGGATLGSWNAYRGEMDVTGGLVESGKLRARMVALYDDRESFVDVVNTKKNLFYGTAELDVTDSTTLSVGATRQEIDGVLDQGLPNYSNGRLPDIKRSTFIGASWNQQDMLSTDYFAELEHRFDGGGHIKLTARSFDREMFYQGLRANGLITASDTVATQYTGFDLQREAKTTDAHVSKPFEVGGLTHSILIGADYRVHDDRSWSSSGFAGPTFSIYAPNHATPIVDIPLTNRSTTHQEEYGTYGQLRVKPIDWATVILGGRVSWWDTLGRNTVTNAVTSNYSIEKEVTPYYGLVVDITDQFAVYGSQAEIFQPQSGTVFGGGALQPRTGEQYEFGIKGEHFGGNLNTHAAVFRIRDDGRSMSDPVNTGFVLPAGKTKSEGFETQATGRLLPNWDVSTGYAYTMTRALTGNSSGSVAGETFAPHIPKHNFNLWTKYLFDEGVLDRFHVAGGLVAVSRFHSQSTTGVRVQQNGYQIVTAQVGYRLSDTWSAAFTVNNLFDNNYYEKVNSGTVARQNFYGEPRAYVLAVKAKW